MCINCLHSLRLSVQQCLITLHWLCLFPWNLPTFKFHKVGKKWSWITWKCRSKTLIGHCINIRQYNALQFPLICSQMLSEKGFLAQHSFNKVIYWWTWHGLNTVKMGSLKFCDNLGRNNNGGGCIQLAWRGQHDKGCLSLDNTDHIYLYWSRSYQWRGKIQYTFPIHPMMLFRSLAAADSSTCAAHQGQCQRSYRD